jgi:ketosteroid isomerase-like protein
MGMPIPVLDAPLAMTDEERAAREAREKREVEELRGAITRAMRSGAWEDAALHLEKLGEAAPDDADFAKWSQVVHDQLAVRDLVDGYRAAQQALDANAYRTMWLGLDDEQVEAIRRSYEDLRSLRLDIDDLSVKISGVNAIVTLRERITFDLRGVGPQQTDSMTTLMLRRTTHGWKIVARTTEQ